MRIEGPHDCLEMRATIFHNSSAMIDTIEMVRIEGPHDCLAMRDTILHNSSATIDTIEMLCLTQWL